MTRIDIFSGFLGAGKTTLIKKMIQEAYAGEKLVLIENEFGEIGIDGGFLREAGVEITEMNSGCICCSLVGDFGAALKKVIGQYAPDRVIIEPSGVGKLSDVIAAVQRAAEHEAVLGSCVAVADATKCKMYMKNFGEFYNNQIETAGCIVLSRTGNISQEKLQAAIDLIRQHNQKATLVTTPWEQLTGQQLRQAMEQTDALAEELKQMAEQLHQAHEHEHHHHEDGECCHHDHDHHHEDGEHHHDHDHHHEDGEHNHGHDHHHEDGEHHHDHDHHHEDGECCHHDHHHHHADEVFTSWGKETTRKFTEEEIQQAMAELDHTEKYGMVLRAKGIVQAQDGGWIHFDHVPGEVDVRRGTPEVIGRLCVIGAQMKEDALAQLFGL